MEGAYQMGFFFRNLKNNKENKEKNKADTELFLGAEPVFRNTPAAHERENPVFDDPISGIKPEDYLHYGIMIIPDARGRLCCYYCGSPVSRSDTCCRECGGQLRINWGVGAVLPERRQRGQLRQKPLNYQVPVKSLHYRYDDHDISTYIDISDGMVHATHKASPARCRDYPSSFFLDRVHYFSPEQQTFLKDLLREAEGCFVNNSSDYHTVNHELEILFTDGSELRFSCSAEKASRRFLQLVDGMNRLAGFHLPPNGLAVVYQGDEEISQRVLHDKERITIGRTPACDIQVKTRDTGAPPILCSISYDVKKEKFTLINHDRYDIRSYTRSITPGASEEFFPDQDLWLSERRLFIRLKQEDPLS